MRRKRDKLRRTVRIEIRRLGSLYLEFKKGNISKIHGNAKDMFLRVNFDKLRDAIDSCSVTEEGKLKPGLNFFLLYLLKRSAKVIKAIAMAKSEEGNAGEIDCFIQVLEL